MIRRPLLERAALDHAPARLADRRLSGSDASPPRIHLAIAAAPEPRDGDQEHEVAAAHVALCREVAHAERQQGE
jgi:hypothetical protein